MNANENKVVVATNDLMRNDIDSMYISNSTIFWQSPIPVTEVRIRVTDNTYQTLSVTSNNVDLSTITLEDDMYSITFVTKKHGFETSVVYTLIQNKGRYFIDNGNGIALHAPSLRLENDVLHIGEIALWENIKVVADFEDGTFKILTEHLKQYTLNLQEHTDKIPVGKFKLVVWSTYRNIYLSEDSEIFLEYNGEHFYLEGEAPNPFKITNLRLEGGYLKFDPVLGVNMYTVWSGHKPYRTMSPSFKVSDLPFRGHLATHTKVRVEYNEYFGEIYLSAVGESVVVSTSLAPKMVKPSNAVIVEDRYLQFPRVPNDYDPTQTTVAFYRLYLNEGDLDHTSSPSSGDTKVSFNLGVGSTIWTGDHPIKAITVGKYGKAHSDTLIIMLRKTTDDKFVNYFATIINN